MRGSTKRTQKLRELSVTTQPRLSSERSVLTTEIYEQFHGIVEMPILRGLNFKNLMEKRKLYLGDGELIVGEKSEGPQVAPTFPELCCHTIEDFEVMDSREYISFKVNEEDRKVHQKKVIPYFKDRSTRHMILDNMTNQWKDCYYAGMFTEFMEQRAPGHTVADDKFYKKGFLDFKREIEEEINNLDFINDKDAFDKSTQLQGMVLSCEAIMIYGQRYGKLAREMAVKETNTKRKKELLWIASNCDVVPANKPETFAQALQMYWFVHIGVTTELNTWDAYSPGKLDQYLEPFYKKEVSEGTLDYESAKELIECLWIKFNNQPAPPKVGVTLKESGTYTDFANINTGGINPETGEDGVNEVSYIILDVMEELKLLQPSSNVQISVKNPDKFLKRACEISRDGWGQPAFYNTEELIEELLNAGKELKDAMYGGSSGCVETGAHGRESYVLTGYLNIPKILEITLNNGFDKISDKQLGLELGYANDFETYESLLEAYKKQLKHFIDIKIIGNNVIEDIFAKHMPSTFLSVVTQGCKESGKDYNAGGAKYNTRYIQIVGIGNIADSLAAIKHNVFDEKRFSMNELIKALDNNFVGHDLIKHLVSNKTPKYGNDDDYADGIMVDIFNTVHQMISGRPTMNGGTYRIDMLPTTCHVYFGSVIGATPNGRLSKMPLPDGISPSKGADTNGPTALIKSASKMNHKITGGTLLNQRFSPETLKGPKGIEHLSTFVKTYFRLEGHHLQFNVFDEKVLKKAQLNPSDYKDLIVRVAGYSDHFNNLEKALQNEIIARTVQEF